MADNLMRASPQALALLGLSPDDHPRPVVADTVQPSLQAIALAMRQSWRLGGEEARMAEFPNDFAKADEDLPSVWERGARGIAAGFASLIPASMTLAGGIIDFMGADEAGQGVAQSGIDVQTWLDQHVAVENPQFFDHLMMGVGSMASFLIPGIGAASAAGRAAQGLKLAGAAAKAFTAVTGAGAMSFLEAGVEQSQRQQELMGQGMTAEQAFAASQPVFWQNMALLTVSNAAGYFSPVGKLLAGTSKARARIAQGVLAAFTEGGQERVQSVIQDVAAGRARWEDFADPSKYQTETLVGALVGGVAGGLTAETEPPAAPTTPAPGQEPPAPAPTGQELADSPLPADDLPLPKDFDLFTGDEEPAGAPTPPPPGTSEPAPATEMPQPESPAQANVEPPAAEPPLVRTPAEMEVPPEVTAQPEAPAPQNGPGNQPNTVVMLAVDLSGNVMGQYSEPYDGTAAGASKANNRLRDRVAAELGGEWSNAGSVTIATDENGLGKYRISPNGRLVESREGTIDLGGIAAPAQEPAPAPPVSSAERLREGRTAKALEARRSFDGQIMTVRQYVEAAVAEGRTVQTAEGQRALMHPDGRYIRQSELTKSGMDYAERLIAERDIKNKASLSGAKQEAPAPAEAPAPTSVGKRDDVIIALNQNLANKGIAGVAEPASPLTKHHDAAAAVADALGADARFFKHTGTDKRLNGSRIMLAGKRPVVALNVESSRPVLTVAAHEISHKMEVTHPDLWRDVHQVIMEQVKPEFLNKFRAERSKLYAKDKIPGELVADTFAEAASRASFWNALRQRNPKAFSALVAQVKSVLAQVRRAVIGGGYAIDIYFNDFSAVENAIADAMSKMSASERQQINESAETLDAIAANNAGDKQKSTGRAVMDRLLGDQDSAKARIKARERNWRDFPRVLYQKMVDRNTWHYVAMRNTLKAAGIDVEKYDMAKNPHLVLQRMAAWTEKADLALRHVVTSWDGSEVLSDGLEVIIRKFNLADAIENGEFGQFMIAARLKAMHDVNGDDFFGPDTLSDGSPNPEYEAAQAEFGDYMEVYNEFGSQQWQDAAAALTEWSNAIMQRLLQSGAISQEQYDGMVEKYDIYAPLYVLEREEENRTTGGSKPKPTAGRVTWNMDTLIPGQVRMDPIEGMIKNVYRIEFLAANNSAKLAAANFVAEMHKTITGRKGSNIPGYGRRVAPKVNPVTKYVGDLLKAAGLSDKQIQSLVDSGQVKDLEAQAKMWVTSSYLENGVVALMRDGEVEYWQFEPDIYNVFASINDKASHQLMSYFTLQTRLLRAGAVLTPEFMARNQFRDFLSAGVLSQNLVKNPVDAALLPLRIMRGLSHAIKKDEVWKQFVMSDAAQANLVALDQENRKKRVDEITRESRTSRQRAGQAVKSPAKYIMHSHPLAVLQAFSKLTENSTRLAVWEKTYNDAIAAGKTHNQARAQAAIQARESSTDFGRAGEYGRVINRIIPFFNASIQGNDKMVRALIVDKGNRGATWIRGAMMITLPSVLLWAINRDDEWYKEQPAWLKNHFWLFSLDGGKTIIKLPKPFEVGMIFGSLPERFLDWVYGEDPKAVGRWADNMLNDVGVLQPGSLGGPLISTIIEVEQNYDAYRGTPIVKGWLQDVVPREQYTANTSEFAKWMGEKFPGGRMSPLMVDHFIRGSFGGLGSWGAEIASNIIMEADPGRREMKPASRLMFDRVPDWMPVLRGLAQTGPTSYTQDLDDMYEEFDRTREAVTTMRALQSGGASKEKFVQLYRERGVDLALNEAVSKGIEPIAKISQQIKFIQSVPADVMDRAAKRARIDELTAMRNTLVTEFMKKYRTIDRDSIQAQVEASIGKVERELDRSKGR